MNFKEIMESEAFQQTAALLEKMTPDQRLMLLVASLRKARRIGLSALSVAALSDDSHLPSKK